MKMFYWETAQLILQFMERVQLTGKEGPAFSQCIQELLEIVKSQERDEVNENN